MVTMIGLDPGNYGTHSMRRTKVALIYKKTGNLRACQLLLGHSKLESTVRYLGVDIDDAISLSEDIEIRNSAGVGILAFFNWHPMMEFFQNRLRGMVPH
jgi:integrase